MWLIQNNCKIFFFFFPVYFFVLFSWLKSLNKIPSTDISKDLYFSVFSFSSSLAEKNWNVYVLSKMILMNKVLAGHVNDACVCLWLIWLLTDSESVLSAKKASVFVIFFFFFSFCCFFQQLLHFKLSNVMLWTLSWTSCFLQIWC